jgi:hypothetical protein
VGHGPQGDGDGDRVNSEGLRPLAMEKDRGVRIFLAGFISNYVARILGIASEKSSDPRRSCAQDVCIRSKYRCSGTTAGFY